MYTLHACLPFLKNSPPVWRWSCKWTEICSCAAIKMNNYLGWKVLMFVYNDIIMKFGFLTGSLRYLIWSCHSDSMQWSVLRWWAMWTCSCPVFQSLCDTFLQLCCWGCIYCRVWYCITWYFLIFQKETRKYQMTEHHITEDLKFQRLCLYCWADVPSSMAAHCVSTCIALSDLLSSLQHLWVSLKLPAGTSGYIDHLVKETDHSDLAAFEQC